VESSLQRVLVGGVITLGEQALHLLEEIAPAPLWMGKHQGKKPLPLPLKRISARPGPVQQTGAPWQFVYQPQFRYWSKHLLLGKKRALQTTLNAKVQGGCDWGTVSGAALIAQRHNACCNCSRCCNKRSGSSA
jgi:hypothetical protein